VPHKCSPFLRKGRESFNKCVCDEELSLKSLGQTQAKKNRQRKCGSFSGGKKSGCRGVILWP